MRSKLILLSMILVLQANAQNDIRKRIQTDMIMAEDGDTIRIDEGVFPIDATLSMEGKKRIVIKGMGNEKTILTFSGQTSGAEGIRISNCSDITIEDITVRDAKGDAIKTMNVNGITFRRVRTDWSGKPNQNNGAYGLYPVSCSRVLIESCIARGASDAGIYVGQSKDIIVRNCKAFENVAGIEIENSVNADVYGNEAYHNTGGILVFDLPDLPVKQGGYCRVFDNKVRDNNLRNFAPKGNIVAGVPQGTGMLLLAANNVEIFRNDISGNRTVGTSVNSYFITENRIKDSAYYPYPTAINIHDNTYTASKKRATMHGRIGKLYRFKLRFGRNVPQIVYDGILDKKIINAAGVYPEGKQICIRNNMGGTFANLDAANGFKKISKDVSPFDCDGVRPAPVRLP